MIWIVLFCSMMLFVYFAIAFFYQNRFMSGTYINDIYCTGKTISEVNFELAGQFPENELTIVDTEGITYHIPLADISYQADYSQQLNQMKDIQKPELWIKGIWSLHKQELIPIYQFDSEKLLTAINDCEILKNNTKKNTVEIQKDLGFVLYDGMHNVLDKDLLIECIEKNLYEGRTKIDISQCYKDLPYTEQMKNTLSLWEKVNAFQTCGIVYDMGDETVSLTPEIVSKWITLKDNHDFYLDENNDLVLNEEKVTEFIDDLCETYDTYEKTHIFTATNGTEVKLTEGTYGNKLDRNKELQYLISAFQDKVVENHIPSYEKLAYVRGRNDIGNTYVEIDMDSQKLYFYKLGELLLETDIVTGNTGRKMGTPSGVYSVNTMQRNRTLRGTGYSAFVKYWVSVKGSIGIHDASWRKEFGGEIYKKNGSHGCINVPKDVMPNLYEELELGIPVIIF